MHLLFLAALVQADDRLARFQAALEASAGEIPKVCDAFAHLAGPKDDRLRDEAIKYVRKGTGAVRSAAGAVLAGYPDDEKASAALLDALAVEPDEQTCVELVQVLAGICPEKHARRYASLMDHPMISVAKLAIGGAEKVRSVELIEPLIKLVSVLEMVVDAKEPDFFSSQRGKVPPIQQRRDECLGPARNALCALTDQKLTAGDEWAAWWKANKKTFKIKP